MSRIKERLYICEHCLAIHDGELGECLEAYIARLKTKVSPHAKDGSPISGSAMIEVLARNPVEFPLSGKPARVV